MFLFIHIISISHFQNNNFFAIIKKDNSDFSYSTSVFVNGLIGGSGQVKAEDQSRSERKLPFLLGLRNKKKDENEKKEPETPTNEEEKSKNNSSDKTPINRKEKLKKNRGNPLLYIGGAGTALTIAPAKLFGGIADRIKGRSLRDAHKTNDIIAATLKPLAWTLYTPVRIVARAAQLGLHLVGDTSRMIRDGKVKGAYTNTRNTIKSSFGQDKQTEVKDKSDTKKRNGCNCNESPCKNVGYSRESRSAFLKAILERYTI